jgi:hypothetical protein
VHLAGQPDAGDRIAGDAVVGEQGADRLLTGAPPVVGILLGPGGARRRERRVVRRCRGEEGASLVQQQRARTARADVDA